MSRLIHAARPALAAALVALAPAGAALAAAHEEADDKTKMKEEVRVAAIAIGNAYVCLDEADREGFQSEVHHLFDLILQDVGSDVAFTYATALGYGAAVEKEDVDCPVALEQWQGMRADFELAGDE